MKFLIVSDLHFGYSDVDVCELSGLFECFDNQVDKIILLGDVIDFWRRSVDDVLIEAKSLLDLIESYDCIYVKGNHDYIISEVLKRDIEIYDEYRFGKYVFNHGHYIDYLMKSDLFVNMNEFENFMREMCYSKTGQGMFFSRMYRCFKLMNMVKRGFGSVSSKSNFDFEKMNQLVKSIYSEGKLVVQGHYHVYDVKSNLVSVPSFIDRMFCILDNNILKVCKFDYLNSKCNVIDSKELFV